MNIVCVMPIHRRKRITIQTILMLKRQTVPVVCLLVGDSTYEQRIALETGSKYLETANQPLGSKWQQGIKFSKNFNPHAILILGSDTWLNPTWAEICFKQIQNGFDVVGLNRWYSCNAIPGKKLEIVQRYYKREPACKQPVGGGRMISRRILEKLSWQLYPAQKSALDSHSFRRLMRGGARVKLLNQVEELKVMGVKSTWPTLNSFKRIKNAPRLGRLPDVANPKEFIEETFPEGISALKRAVPGVKI